MVCAYECGFSLKRPSLDFPCSSNWADPTGQWDKSPRQSKRKTTQKKDDKTSKKTPTKFHKLAPKTPKSEVPRPYKPPCVKTFESKSAGEIGRKVLPKIVRAHEEKSKRAIVPCKVVNFTGIGKKFCVLSSNTLNIRNERDIRSRSVPILDEVSMWSEEEERAQVSDIVSLCSESVNALDNKVIESKSNFFKLDLLEHLHARSQSLVNYLASMRDKTRLNELTVDNVSLPTYKPASIDSRSPSVKQFLPPPKEVVNGDFVSALISKRKLGEPGYLTRHALHLTQQTLDFQTKTVLPPLQDEEPAQPGDKSYLDSVSQLVGLLCLESKGTNLPQQSVQRWLDT